MKDASFTFHMRRAVQSVIADLLVRCYNGTLNYLLHKWTVMMIIKRFTMAYSAVLVVSSLWSFLLLSVQLLSVVCHPIQHYPCNIIPTPQLWQNMSTESPLAGSTDTPPWLNLMPEPGLKSPGFYPSWKNHNPRTDC